MRERKWRVWALGKMYYPSTITFDAQGVTFAPDDMGGGSVRSENVMEFTGFCDSTGKEVYEGDVIESRCDDGQWVVVWWPQEARFILVDSLPATEAAKEELVIGTTDRVIGNTFEPMEPQP